MHYIHYALLVIYTPNHIKGDSHALVYHFKYEHKLSSDNICFDLLKKYSIGFGWMATTLSVPNLKGYIRAVWGTSDIKCLITFTIGHL